ncbi:unnamed protein product [Toxocara canis]|uniref:G_PROTEIN_RECEP_F1_2 domain-containing protein n=1 Tax=Toxocara canis TaxID=6265 RepID=A0A183U399_TOXCA|nr:unnamed protein product [Toxocara canis]
MRMCAVEATCFYAAVAICVSDKNEERRREAITMTTPKYGVGSCAEYAKGTLACQQQQQQQSQHTLFEVYVRNVYPPIQELQPKILAVVVIFVLCFIVGVCGNSSILTIIRGVILERRSSSRSGRRQGEHAILYIAALCVVDFLMSLSLPPAIIRISSTVESRRVGADVCGNSSVAELRFARGETWVRFPVASHNTIDNPTRAWLTTGQNMQRGGGAGRANIDPSQ